MLLCSRSSFRLLSFSLFHTYTHTRTHTHNFIFFPLVKSATHLCNLLLPHLIPGLKRGQTRTPFLGDEAQGTPIRTWQFFCTGHVQPLWHMQLFGSNHHLQPIQLLLH
ncbi:hypothetical protein F5X99DRAFT_391617 [Biscogniauxia marginata]|nr:hypothetical protein F5X99DRAFT_391617 [Biscogniauxia marginata]